AGRGGSARGRRTRRGGSARGGRGRRGSGWADEDAARGRGEEAEEGGEEGGLAGTAGAGEGDYLARSEGEGQVAGCGGGAVRVGHLDRLGGDDGGVQGRYQAVAAIRDGGFQDGEDLAGGGQTVGAGVEVGTDGP